MKGKEMYRKIMDSDWEWWDWVRGVKEKRCEKCGRPFMPRSRIQKYCSEPCGLHRRKLK